MGRPEGSRIHEHAIRAAISSLELDGWRLLRVRNMNVPLVASKNGKVRVAGHAAWGWPTDPTDADAYAQLKKSCDEYHSIGTKDSHWHLKGSDMVPFMGAVKDDLDATAKAWETEGWKVLRLYGLRVSGYLGCVQPDGIACRPNELWAIEATSNPPLRRIQPYAMFDGVVVARFRPGSVFHADLPPPIVIELYKGGAIVRSTRPTPPQMGAEA